MTADVSGDGFANPDPLRCAKADELTDLELALIAELNPTATGENDAILRPKVVADINQPDMRIGLEGKEGKSLGAERAQCANTTTSPNLNTTNSHTDTAVEDHHKAYTEGEGTKRREEKSDETTVKNVGPLGSRISSSLLAVPTRKPKRSAASLEGVAFNKTWTGTKSKKHKDRLNHAEKFSAAVGHAAAVKGVAISLNLGDRREDLLRHHANPRRRFMQNLHRHLKDAGFERMPYAFAFELAPDKDGGRLHLHGVLDTSGLTENDLDRLRDVLCKAASPAAGPVSGDRQVDLREIHAASGWTDYILKSATRTARELGIDHPFMMNTPMNRAARAHFENLRSIIRERIEGQKRSVMQADLSRSKTTKKADTRFTLRPASAIDRPSGERDRRSAGVARISTSRRPKPALEKRRAGR